MAAERPVMGLAGNWGYEPKDGDGALDGMGPIHDAAGRHLKSLAAKPLTDPHERWIRAGTVQEAVEMGIHVPCDAVKAAILDIDACLGNKQWVDEWKSSAGVRRTGQKVRDRLAAEQHRQCRLPASELYAPGPLLTRKRRSR